MLFYPVILKMEKQNKEWKVAVLPGDGVGPEVMSAAMGVLEAVKNRFGLDTKTEKGEAGLHCVEKHGTNLPKETIDLLKRSDCVLKGPMTTPEGTGSLVSAAVQIRKMFDLYANVRPSKTLPKVPSLKPGVDMVIIRENTQGAYSGLEFSIGKDAAIGIRMITRDACQRICRFGFELARKRKKHLTLVHKANVLKASDGLFKDVFYKMAEEYKDVKADDAHIDAMTQWLIKQPDAYDVIVTENLFGDIISDEAAMVVGGIGTGGSANIGNKYAMFEPIHGSVPKYTGMDKVNPIGMVMAMKMMFEWMGYEEAATAVEKAVSELLESGKVLTYDLGGKSKCSEVGKAIASKI